MVRTALAASAFRCCGDGTITTSGAISGGLNGDGVTRAKAITFLSGVHTLTLQTGATFAGNVVVDTAATSNAGVSASNTLALDGAGTGTISLPQFQNFGHLTQTSGSGGTWTLTGAGAVTLDTTVSAGTMVLGAGAVLTSPNVNLLTGGTLSLSTAALANDALNINGGTLQVTGITLNSLPNTIAYGANGGTFDIVAAANTFSISQALAGAGSLTKIGAGTLALTGDNTYSGGTTISAGTLQLGNGGTTGSVAGNILNNAILAFNRSNALTFGGVISGTGAVQQNGAGTTILTADNTYTGGTTINAGTLQLGNGGTAGSIVGNVLNNGALAFNRSDAVTFGGVISGTGALQQNGAGSTNLTADEYLYRRNHGECRHAVGERLDRHLERRDGEQRRHAWRHRRAADRPRSMAARSRRAIRSARSRSAAASHSSVPATTSSRWRRRTPTAPT